MEEARFEKILYEAFQYHQQGNIKNAAICYNKLISEGFKDPRVYSNLGAIFEQIGKIEKAIQLYKLSISYFPDDTNSHYNLGSLLYKQNKLDEAEKNILKALQLNPRFELAFINLGAIYLDQKKIDNALKYTQKALKINPNSSKALVNLANINAFQSNLKSAEIFLKKSLAIDKNDENTYYNLASILFKQERYEEAKKNIKKALDIRSDLEKIYLLYTGILSNLNDNKEAEIICEKGLIALPGSIGLLFNLAHTKYEKKEFQEALELINKVIKKKKDHARAYLLKGTILKNLGKLEESILSTRKSIEINSEFAEGHHNLSTSIRETNNLEEAEFHARKAIELNKKCDESYLSLASILRLQMRIKEGIFALRESIDLNPNNPASHYNLSHLLLKSKEFKEGWKEYEWRWKRNKIENPFQDKYQNNTKQWEPKYRGKVLLWAEQGIGDEITFGSLIPDLYKKVEKLIVHMDKRLIPLFKRSLNKNIDFRDKDEVINAKEYDYQIAMGSVPQYLRQDIESFKSYNKDLLKCDRSKSKSFRELIKAKDSEKIIGISWRSSSKSMNNKSYSIEEFITNINAPNVKFVNLQYGDVKEEIDLIKSKYNIEIQEIDTIDKFNNIDDLAALIDSCDSIVSIENITAYLAGALGKECKLILSNTDSCYNSYEDSNSIWFPSIKLYTQENFKNKITILKKIKLDF